MSVDVQTSAATPNAENTHSQVGRACYVGAHAAVGIVTAVEPGGAVLVALPLGSTVTVEPGQGVILPRVGEFVEMPRAGGLLRGYWIGLVPPPVAGEAITARVVAGTEVVEHRTDAVSVGAPRIVTGAAEPGLVGVVEAVAQACGLLDSERRRHEVWKADLNEAACERADDQGWCSEFDGFMTDWGMAGRRRDYLVEVDVSARVTVRVEATSASEAEEAVTRARVSEAAQAAGHRLADLDFDFQTRDAEEA